MFYLFHIHIFTFSSIKMSQALLHKNPHFRCWGILKLQLTLILSVYFKRAVTCRPNVDLPDSFNINPTSARDYMYSPQLYAYRQCLNKRRMTHPKLSLIFERMILADTLCCHHIKGVIWSNAMCPVQTQVKKEGSTPPE